MLDLAFFVMLLTRVALSEAVENTVLAMLQSLYEADLAYEVRGRYYTPVVSPATCADIYKCILNGNSSGKRASKLSGVAARLRRVQLMVKEFVDNVLPLADREYYDFHPFGMRLLPTKHTALERYWHFSSTYSGDYSIHDVVGAVQAYTGPDKPPIGPDRAYSEWLHHVSLRTPEGTCWQRAVCPGQDLSSLGFRPTTCQVRTAFRVDNFSLAVRAGEWYHVPKVVDTRVDDVVFFGQLEDDVTVGAAVPVEDLFGPFLYDQTLCGLRATYHAIPNAHPWGDLSGWEDKHSVYRMIMQRVESLAAVRSRTEGAFGDAFSSALTVSLLARSVGTQSLLCMRINVALEKWVLDDFRACFGMPICTLALVVDPNLHASIKAALPYMVVVPYGCEPPPGIAYALFYHPLGGVVDWSIELKHYLGFGVLFPVGYVPVAGRGCDDLLVGDDCSIEVVRPASGSNASGHEGPRVVLDVGDCSTAVVPLTYEEEMD